MLSKNQLLAAEETLGELSRWDKQCHAASLHLVKSGVLGESARVARGWCTGIRGQHSWVVLGNPYMPDYIYDATRWCYEKDRVIRVYHGSDIFNDYSPHGLGHFVSKGMPPKPEGDIITLNVEWSMRAMKFFNMIGYGLDARGWHHIANLPIHGWPSREIITRIYEDKRLRAFAPIDIVGMLTDKNPDGLYF